MVRSSISMEEPMPSSWGCISTRSGPQERSFCLGIYTNGVHWQFYTDLDNGNIMDKEPFLSWDISTMTRSRSIS